MEKIVLLRGTVRASFTRTYNRLINELNKPEPNAEAAKLISIKLERLALELHEFDKQVQDIWSCTDKFDAEYQGVEEYKDKLDEARCKYENFSCPPIVSNDSRSVDQMSVAELSAASANGNRTKLKLPKIEFKSFNGEIKEWLAFWSQFKRIHDDAFMEPEDKFQYLIMATKEGSKARQIVESFPPTAENYDKVIDTLECRFGRKEMLWEYYTRELVGMVIKNVTCSKNEVTPELYDKLESHLRALDSIGLTRDKFAAVLFPLVESCIPEQTLRIWLRTSSNYAKNEENQNEDIYVGKLEQLLSFIRAEVESEERILLAKSGIETSSHSTYKKGIPKKAETALVPTANHLFSGEVNYKNTLKNTCLFCSKQHESKDCFVAQKMNLSKKREILNKNRACYSCLRVGHRAKDCKMPTQCLLCGRRHVAIMCAELPSNKEEQKGELLKDTVAASICCSQEVFLQTLRLKIKYGCKERVVRALLDSGSQRSYILKRTAEDLGCWPVGRENLTQVLFGGTVTKEKSLRKFNVKVEGLHENCSRNMLVLEQSVICGSIPRLKRGSWTKELEENGIRLTDAGDDRPEIEMLIGADVVGEIITGKKYQLSCGLVAIETLFGWVVFGKIIDAQPKTACANLVIAMHVYEESLQNLWNLDILGITDTAERQSREEREAAVVDHFKRTTTCTAEGRYQICLPWLDNKSELHDNRAVAEKRLISMTSKLIQNHQYESYDAVFKEWIDEGIIEVISNDQIDNEGYYLPHRGVFKTNSTTKVRPVFDASSKAKGSLSLNDCLEKGPNLLELIPSVLMRFREERIGIIADIRKAFLQISVEPKDRDYLRFLWWENFDKKQIRIYRHCRVVFGVNCSPFLLEAVLTQHLENCAPEYENIANKLRNSFYVDNCVVSVSSVEEKNQFIRASTKLLASAKFDLRGWESTVVAEEQREEKEEEPSLVLGLVWDRFEDVLFCNIENIENFEGVVTRRDLLSSALKVFDPLGFLCPVTLLPKILLQESWKDKSGWDDPMPEGSKAKFIKWIQDTPNLRNIKIPRCVQYFANEGTFSLHTFCDASKSAYAAVVYLRREWRGIVSVQLVFAKARVAPLKQVTIPRLELLACLIGSRLSNSVKEAMNLWEVPLYFWTDSTTALCWIKNEEPWTTFVFNRVKEIRRLTNAEDWKYIPGIHNPADLPSRGCSAKGLLQSRWWEGPEWLRGEESCWPEATFLPNEEEVLCERKKGLILSMASEIEDNNIWYLNYFSSYIKIKRMVGWTLRFINNVRKRSGIILKGNLSVTEIDNAEKLLVRLVQKDRSVKEEMDNLHSLCVFTDPDGILRVKTKIIQREDEESFRTPMVLPSSHEMVRRLILEEHLRQGHAGVQTLLCSIRERFWILKGRKTIRNVIAKCVKCKRYKACNISPIPPVLPEDRVREAKVFEVTGVDLAGPLMLRNGKKSWLVLYTCAVYRAVHIELVTSLTTNGFLQSFRRFVSRRGRPKVVYSDNGTNFVGAVNLFETIDWSSIENDAGVSRIQWKFNPPTAAWWGGWWERLIRMIKDLLKRMLGCASLKYEELLTILCECEAIINSRPLTYVSEDTEDLVPLTPAMFLQDSLCVGVPDVDQLDKVNVTKRYRYLQRLRTDLRKRFRSEYLGKLVSHYKNKHTELKIEPEDVVLVGNDNQKRLFWPIARVLEVYPGKDQVVRVARLKTTKGEIIRPVQRLYPMEISTPKNLWSSSDEVETSKEEVSIQEPEKTITTRSGRRVKLPLKYLL